MTHGAELLIYVEDPGAANFVATLPAALAEKGKQALVLARGHGAAQLAVLGCPFDTPPTDASVESIVRTYQPRLIMVGTSENPDTLGLELVSVGRMHGLTVVGAIDGPANPTYRFRGRHPSPRAFIPDWLFTPDEATRQSYIRIGVPPDRIVAIGHPYHDYVHQQGCVLRATGKSRVRHTLWPDFPPDRPLIVFSTELSDGLNPTQFRLSPEYTLRGRGGSIARTDIVLEEVLDAIAEMTSRPLFVLRLHPKEAANAYRAYHDEIDAVSERGSSLQVSYAADLVVGMTSIFLLEAALLGRQSLSIVPRWEERDWLPSIGAGVTPCVTKRELIAPAMERSLTTPPPDQQTIDAIFPPGATQAMVTQLEVMMENSASYADTDSRGH